MLILKQKNPLMIEITIFSAVWVKDKLAKDIFNKKQAKKQQKK